MAATRKASGRPSRFLALALLALGMPLAVLVTVGSFDWPGLTFPGFFVLRNRVVPMSLFSWTGPRSGVPVGARVLAVAGAEVASNREVYDRIASLQPGVPVPYRLAWRDRQFDVLVSTMRFGTRDYLLTFALLISSGLLFLVGSVVVGLLRPASPDARAFTMLGAANVLYLFGLTAATHPVLGSLSFAYTLGLALFPGAMTHLGLCFPIERPLVRRWPMVLAIPYVASAVLAMWTTMQFYGEPPTRFAEEIAHGVAVIATGVAIGVAALSYWRNRSYLVRPRMDAATPGIVLAAGVGLFGLVTISLGGGAFSIVLVSLTPALLYLAIGYAIVRGAASDRDILLQRALDLEDQVRERTHELARANDQLAAACEELKRTQAKLVRTERLASIGELTAGLAHEINSPLATVVGSLAPLRRGLASVGERADVLCDETLHAIATRVGSIVDLLDHGARRVTAIVAHLRTVAVVEPPMMQPVDMVSEMTDALEALRPRWQDRITVHTSYARLPTVDGASHHIGQLFRHLLSNACDAISERGNIWITTGAAGSHALVTVRDDGCGIPPEHLGRIFDPFFTTKAVGAGMGLGLAMSAGIVRAHGGALEVASEPGQGSSFTVKLPFAVPAPGEGPPLA